MLRSLSSAVSGLRNHQNKLDVVGNNIANVNTVGYKSESARFQDLFSQTMQGASAPLDNRGGTNPMQVGLGMEMGAITTMHTQGAITSTGRETDLAIEGNGFFVVNDGQQNYYTRDGSFSRDATGTLVNSDGLKLMGWTGEEEDFEPADIGELHIPLGEEMVARPTSEVKFSGNLDARGEADEYDYSYDAYVYDSLGNRHLIRFTFTAEDDNEWALSATLLDLDEDGQISFDEEGDPEGTVLDGLDENLHFTSSGKFELVDEDENGDEREYVISIEEGDLDTGADDLEIALDFTKLTQLAQQSNVVAREQDGFPAGELAAFEIDPSGAIMGTYTNGMVETLGFVAMANFSNPEGLTKMGGNLYDITSNSGDARIGRPGMDGRGAIQARSLEMSNVDLADEFTEMITTSRAFQANTRMITTSDEVLVELINIKR